MSDKEVIDDGGEYRFVPDFTTKKLPGGVYYPDYNKNGEFVLVESADFPNDPDTDENEPPFGEIVSHEEPFFNPKNGRNGSLERAVQRSKEALDEAHPEDPRDADQETADDSDDNSGVKTDEIEADWANDGYFPLENYNDGLEEAEENINKFITSKDYYDENGIDYRRSVLFYGPPGTGKSQYVSNKSFELVRKLNAVVVRLETHAQVEIFAEDGMREVADGLPERFKVIVLEELSELTKHDQVRQYVVNILDSRQLRENVVFLATTNEPQHLPQNFVDRPGRLDFLQGVESRGNDPEYIPKFYEHLIGEEYPVDDEEWTEKICKELTLAYVKGLFITAKERNEGLKRTYQRIKKRRQLVNNDFRRKKTGFKPNPDSS